MPPLTASRGQPVAQMAELSRQPGKPPQGVKTGLPCLGRHDSKTEVGPPSSDVLTAVPCSVALTPSARPMLGRPAKSFQDPVGRMPQVSAKAPAMTDAKVPTSPAKRPQNPFSIGKGSAQPTHTWRLNETSQERPNKVAPPRFPARLCAQTNGKPTLSPVPALVVEMPISAWVAPIGHPLRLHTGVQGKQTLEEKSCPVI